MRNGPVRRPTAILVVSLCAIGSWALVSANASSFGVPSFAVPDVKEIWRELLAITPADIAVSGARIAFALAMSFMVALPLSCMASLWYVVQRYANAVIQMITAVPSISWVLLAILWFRGSEFRVAFVLFMTCMPVFYVTISDAMRRVPSEQRDLMRTYAASPTLFCLKLLIPAVVPDILTAWRINLGLAIRVVTIAELVGAVSGVGHRLAVAQEMLSVAGVVAWTMVLVVFLLLAESLLGWVERRLMQARGS